MTPKSGIDVDAELARASQAQAVTVETTLRIFNVVESVEVIQMPIPGNEGIVRNEPGHRRVTVFALNARNEPLSFDVERETFDRFIAPLIALSRLLRR